MTTIAWTIVIVFLATIIALLMQLVDLFVSIKEQLEQIDWTTGGSMDMEDFIKELWQSRGRLKRE